MEWKKDLNKRALGIVRRSGLGQKENTSAETQERELRRYAQANGLELILIEPIIETAYKTEKRKKYQALMQYAQSQGIKHILFYIGSREARNLTDNEVNENLIKEDKIVIHHVSDGKVYWKGSPDSDFLNRDLIAAVNKHQSRENGTKMKASYKTKAEQGWWPYRHTTLGYIHHKEKDRYGNALKGTAKIIVNPDKDVVRLVQREFELRAQGISYDEIRHLNLAEKDLVPEELRKTYSRHAIEVRLKNEFYWGYFHLYEDPIRYEGKHEKIIPTKTLNAVEAVNSGNACKYRKSSVVGGDDIFRGWLKCDHPECQRLITYEKKKKILKSTGEAKVYHLYRCSNSRKIHDKHVYVSEEKLWEQFEPTVDRYDITKEFAADISRELENSFEKQRLAIKKQMEGYRIALKGLEENEDTAYDDLKKGVLREEQYQRKILNIRAERDELNLQLEHLTLLINDSGNDAIKKMFELAIDAKSLWKSMDRQERVSYLKKVCSNPTLDDLSLRFDIKKPFARIASWKGNSNWRRE